MKSADPQSTILFFDGVCNLCNSFIDFIVRTDSKCVIKVTSLQGPTAKALLPEPLVVDFQSVVLRLNGQIYVASEAVWRVFSLLPYPYRLATLMRFLPTPLRDAAYRLVARYRYRIFGIRQTCRLPTPADKAHFVNEP